MKKSFVFTVVLFSLVVLSVSGPIYAAKIGIDLNCTMKPGGAEEAAILKFKEIVQEKSGGRMQVKVFMSGQLGKENAVLELLKIGQTQMALTGGNFRNMYAKKYDPVTIPFLLKDWAAVKDYLEGPMGAKIKELSAKNGGVYDFGPQKRSPRKMTSNEPIKGPDDLTGLKLRLPAVPIWVDVWKQLGTLPTVIPAPEIYLAMKTGQVSAHENTLVSPYSRKLWEVQKYIIETDHIFWPWHWVASKVWFDKLSSADRQLIKDAVEIARRHGGKVEDQKEAFYRAELKKKGMRFITPDKAAINAKAEPAIERALKNLDVEVAEEVKRLNAR